MQPLGLILIVLFSGVSFIALLAALSLVLPIPVERTHQKLDKSLGLSFLLGLVNIIFFTIIVGLCIYLGRAIGGGPISSIPFLLGALILAALSVFTLLGLVAAAKLLGERMGKTKSALWSDLSGGLLLVLAGLTPYIGWFVFTPAVVCASLGATILALFQKKPKVVTV